MSLVAALPMYDFPWTRRANDALWGNLALRLRAANIAAPLELSRGEDIDALWRDPKLLFAQTCGYPYFKGLREAVRLVATPVYDFDGCRGAEHCAFLIAAKGDAGGLEEFRGARAACNALDSNSGMNLFRALIAPLAQEKRFFSSIVWTGSHFESLRAVASGRASLAAIDCVSFGQIAMGAPELVEKARVVARSPMSPGPPFIASAKLPDDHVRALREALDAALRDPSLAPALQILRLKQVEILSEVDYGRIATLERDAIALGYPTLA